MRVRLDTSRCQGHGQCNMTAPDVFAFDEQGFAVLQMEVVPAELEEPVNTAVQRCPERAISTAPE